MRIGLLGAGTVGAALLELLAARREVPARVAKVLVRDPGRARANLAPEQLTTDPEAVLAEADVLVELMGGTTLAADLMLAALARGLPVVTANKAALAERWEEFAPAVAAGKLYFEAAVMAGTPAIGPLSGVLRGSRPLELHAILNGTCSYILGQLEAGVPYAEALAEAQRLGYAEADPALDVGGIDAAHKLSLLLRLTFDPAASWAAVRENTQGVTELTPEKMRLAQRRGGRIQLLGSIYPEAGAWRAAVRPVLLPEAHPLARVAGGRNALYFKGDAVGEVLISGAGAGGMATASGVLGDLLAVIAGRPGPAPLIRALPLPRAAHPEPLEVAS